MTSPASPAARRARLMGHEISAGLRRMGRGPQDRGEPPPAALASQTPPPRLSSPEEEGGVWPSPKAVMLPGALIQRQGGEGGIQVHRRGWKDPRALACASHEGEESQRGE